METPNYRKASIYFDDETVLEVQQRGGGGSGVGGDTGLSAVNLITGESTNDAIAEKDETIEQQAGEISDLEDEVAAKQAIIDAFPTIEALNVTANGTYNEEGKAYKPVTVNVPEATNRKLYGFNVFFTNNLGYTIIYADLQKRDAANLSTGFYNNRLRTAVNISVALYGFIGEIYSSQYPREFNFITNAPVVEVISTANNWTASSGPVGNGLTNLQLITVKYNGTDTITGDYVASLINSGVCHIRLADA